MPYVEKPELVVLKSGVPQRYLGYSLAVLKKYREYADGHRECCKYTKNLPTAIKRGIGVCMFGANNEFRKQAFYGMVKAAIAQDYSVQVIDIEDLLQAHSKKTDLYDRCFKVDILAFPEMEMPESIVNNYIRAIVHRVVKKRAENGKPMLFATALEVKHPDHSLDMLYTGLGRYIIDNTVLFNFAHNNNCKWLKEGHPMKLASLAVGRMDKEKKTKKKLKFKKK